MREAGWKPEDVDPGDDVPLIGSKHAPRSKVLGELLADGLHFTEKAYGILFEELAKVIGERYPEEMPERLPWVFPDWKVVMGVNN